MNLILNDLELMARVRSGDTEAFQAVAERYYNRIATYFIRCGNPHELVKDLTQWTFLRAFEHGRRHEIRAVEELLFEVARSVQRDQARRDICRGEKHDQYRRVAPTEAKAADADFEARETVGVVRGAVELLPPVQRLLVELHYLQGRSLPEVARQTGMSVHNVKGYLGRARAKLHDLLEPWWKGGRS